MKHDFWSDMSDSLKAKRQKTNKKIRASLNCMTPEEFHADGEAQKKLFAILVDLAPELHVKKEIKW